MEFFLFDDFSVTLDREGAREFSKVTYPIRYGRFSEIKTSDYLFQFDLNGEIKYIQGRGALWPHPAEWLKRTAGNDWVYYSAGDYKGVFELFGEYYFPCLPYPSNSVMGENPFEDQAVRLALSSWKDFQTAIRKINTQNLPPSLQYFFNTIRGSQEDRLRAKAQTLHQIIGGRVTVLPPDCRHVDYEVIPVMVADGCLYHCDFCQVASHRPFAPREKKSVLEQIKHLKNFFGENLINYNALYLGEHDALKVGRDFLEMTLETAYRKFQFERSTMKGAWLFLFGSADSLLQTEESLFESLNRLPYTSYLNVGLESADPKTLARLGKPLTAEKIRETFARTIEINHTYERIVVTVNFLLAEDLSPDHVASLSELIGNPRDFFPPKGGIYLSPLMTGGEKREIHRRKLLKTFYAIKASTPLPTFLYLIQRL